MSEDLLARALAHADESEDKDEALFQSARFYAAADAGTVWIPEAENLTAVGTSGTMLGGPPRVVWHTTEAPSGGGYFDAMHRVLTSKKAEPHILWDPLTDRMGQYFPLNRSARALRNHSEQSTNKTGVTCIQIEVVGYAARPFTETWRPGPNFAALMRAIRSWGIPDEWPAGRMSQGGEDVSRDLTTYRTRAGHYGHCHVRGNSHWDCGGIDQRAIFGFPSDDNQEEDDMNAEQDARLERIEQIVMRGRNGGVQDNHMLGKAILAEVKVLRTAVQALADSSNADSEEVMAAVTAGIDRALDDLKITLSTDDDPPA